MGDADVFGDAVEILHPQRLFVLEHDQGMVDVLGVKPAVAAEVPGVVFAAGHRLPHFRIAGGDPLHSPGATVQVQ